MNNLALKRDGETVDWTTWGYIILEYYTVPKIKMCCLVTTTISRKNNWFQERDP